jgi:hypothetical protein
MRRFRSLFLALGFVTVACLNPKTDDLPVRDDDDSIDGDNGNGGGLDNPPVGSAGGSNGAAGSSTGDGSGGTGEGAGAGGGGTGEFDADAGIPDDGGLLSDSTLNPDGGDAGTQ